MENIESEYITNIDIHTYCYLCNQNSFKIMHNLINQINVRSTASKPYPSMADILTTITNTPSHTTTPFLSSKVQTIQQNHRLHMESHNTPRYNPQLSSLSFPVIRPQPHLHHTLSHYTPHPRPYSTTQIYPPPFYTPPLHTPPSPAPPHVTAVPLLQLCKAHYTTSLVVRQH